MSAADRFRAAVERRDLTAMDALFADDVRFNSPVTFTPFEGKPAVLGLFGVLLRVFEDFRYVGKLDGEAETSADGAETPATVLVFSTTVRGRQIHGVDLIHLDDAGLIKEFAVMVRPKSAVEALGEAVGDALAAEGLLPAR
ncbi:nuclear transport factor 2 family protein [Nonomuraea sp. KC401]|uniref:nuclear transport factor 2 family protein n=1 Tax=unclassified Nonomuraea TaxID=2593643 RepID=UPI0010FF4C0E|nr:MULTISPECIES: nuclear transport factor 2 family protein [unclassified Nonomuraea]NBE96865.1 nuclear transport factor 2 family protein [Nonomuraea sp. K271]TLF66470.1 nuclear transport factor 2 family protein [Nonomuraea sp. KC401]